MKKNTTQGKQRNENKPNEKNNNNNSSSSGKKIDGIERNMTRTQLAKWDNVDDVDDDDDGKCRNAEAKNRARDNQEKRGQVMKQRNMSTNDRTK